MAPLNWKHHTLVQALIARGPLGDEDFRKIFSEVASRNPSRSKEREFNDFLLKINKELSYVQMELRCCRDQNDGTVCYGLVNNVSDDQSKLGTRYSVPQISLFKAILEAIVQDVTAKGSISTIDALNTRLESQVQIEAGSESQDNLTSIPAALRNFSMSQKEKTIHDLVNDNWLCHTPEGEIGLGGKSYIDLRSWFHNSGIPTCDVCNEPGVKATVCPNEDCTVRIHDYCLKKKLSQSRGKIVCSSCGSRWPCKFPKAEEVMEDESEPVEAHQNQPSVGSSRSKKRKATRNLVIDDAGCSSSQAANPVSASSRVTRASARTS